MIRFSKTAKKLSRPDNPTPLTGFLGDGRKKLSVTPDTGDGKMPQNDGW